MAEDKTNLILVTGSDLDGIATTTRKLAVKLAGEKPDPFLFDVVQEGDQVSEVEALNQTIASILSPPFIGGPKIVWLKNFTGFPDETKKAAGDARGNAYDRLLELLNKGVPADIVLILSGAGVDRRKRLYKLCKSKGRVIECEKPDIKERGWEDRLAGLIGQRARAIGLNLSPEVCDHLVTVIGTDTGRIAQELEKLQTYIQGSDDTITVELAQELCHGDGETVSWALGGALGERDLAKALDIVDTLLSRERTPEGAIIGQILQLAGQVRNMLQIKILMQNHKLRGAYGLQSFLASLDDERKAVLREEGLEVVTFHPFRAKMLANHADNYNGPELVDAMRTLRDAHLQCVSGAGANRVVIEQALAKICDRE